MTEFQINDPSLESQWRAIILFGKNSAAYKFDFFHRSKKADISTDIVNNLFHKWQLNFGTDSSGNKNQRL